MYSSLEFELLKVLDIHDAMLTSGLIVSLNCVYREKRHAGDLVEFGGGTGPGSGGNCISGIVMLHVFCTTGDQKFQPSFSSACMQVFRSTVSEELHFMQVQQQLWRSFTSRFSSDWHRSEQRESMPSSLFQMFTFNVSLRPICPVESARVLNYLIRCSSKIYRRSFSMYSV